VLPVGIERETLRSVERCCPSAAQARRSETCSCARTCSIDARIDDIRRRERDGAVELRRLRVGARVRILGGPFRDHLGLCTAMTGRERVLVLLNVLGMRRQVRRRSRQIGRPR
jgi:hypothetical protein